MKTPKVAFLSALALCTLASCGGGSTPKPTTPHEKVRYALNGVETSFKNKKAATRKLPAKNRFVGDGERDALNEIKGLYTQDDLRTLDLDDISYNQPPMVQFQYLKKVFERIGDSFEFGTKYFDDIHGEVYVDLETGLKAEEKEEYKCNYDFSFAIALSIDDRDFITADVTFDITLTKGAIRYDSSWYVGMDLTYDMNGDSPTYTMLMMTRSDERDVPFRDEVVYEYDYVDVKQGTIEEWRKFDLGTSDPLVKDETHSSFDDYASQDGFAYRVGHCSWLLDGDFRKFTRMSDDKGRTIANKMFNGLGFNDTAIDPTPFVSKQGTRNGAIKEIYAEFTRMRGSDIFYDLFCKEGGDEGGDARENYREIVLFGDDHETRMGGFDIGDVSVNDAIFGGPSHPYHLHYLDGNGGLSDEIFGLSGFTLGFGILAYGTDKTVDATSGDYLHHCFDVYKQTFFPDAQLTEEGRNAFLVLRDNDNEGVEGTVTFHYTGSEYPSEGGDQTPSWPKDWQSIGLNEPVRTGPIVYAGDTVVVDGVTAKEWRAYLDRLTNDRWFCRGILDNDARSTCYRDLDSGKGSYVFDIVNAGPSKSGEGYMLEFSLREESANPLYAVNGIPMARNADGRYAAVIGPLQKGDSLTISRDGYGDVDVRPSEWEGNNLDAELRVRVACEAVNVYYDASLRELFLEGFDEEGGDPSGIDVESVSLCGSINGWEPSDLSYAFSPTDEDNVFRGQFRFIHQDKFKIVVNGSWDIGGGFGYDCFDESLMEYHDMFELDLSDDNRNIIIPQDCSVDLQVRLSFDEKGAHATITVLAVKPITQ